MLAAAIAALVAGTAANAKAQRQVRSAQRSAYNAYADRTDKRTAEAQGLFDDSLKKQDVDVQQAAVDAAAKAKTDRVGDLISQQNYVTPTLPGQNKAPQVIQSAVSTDLASELARARAQIGAIAKLEGFSTRTFDRGLELDHVKPQFRNIGLFSQGDRNIFDAQSAEAQHAGDNMAMLGDVLTSLGQIGLMAYGGGAMGGAAKVVGGGAGTMDSALAGSKAASLFGKGSMFA
ncbi:MAG: hypothetical protein DYH20_00975 [Gammaproteobacteria bacterium PRO9]|nr:hypothetical protein [Gammaproteobacteria bacterium PRO9]